MQGEERERATHPRLTHPKKETTRKRTVKEDSLFWCVSNSRRAIVLALALPLCPIALEAPRDPSIPPSSEFHVLLQALVLVARSAAPAAVSDSPAAPPTTDLSCSGTSCGSGSGWRSSWRRASTSLRRVSRPPRSRPLSSSPPTPGTTSSEHPGPPSRRRPTQPTSSSRLTATVRGARGQWERRARVPRDLLARLSFTRPARSVRAQPPSPTSLRSVHFFVCAVRGLDRISPGSSISEARPISPSPVRRFRLDEDSASVISARDHVFSRPISGTAHRRSS